MPGLTSYKTLSYTSSGAYQESGSKFLAFAFPAENKNDVDSLLLEIRHAHPKARHHCYAYRLIEGNEVTEFGSDAGEPPGSAGLPILGELKRRDLVNVCVIVVRYFGGTKLGIPGLINAYRLSTASAIESNEIVHTVRTQEYRVEMPIALQPVFYSAAKQLGYPLLSPQYDTRFSVGILVPLENAPDHLHRVVVKLAGVEGDIKHLCEKLEIEITEK